MRGIRIIMVDGLGFWICKVVFGVFGYGCEADMIGLSSCILRRCRQVLRIIHARLA